MIARALEVRDAVTVAEKLHAVTVWQVHGPAIHSRFATAYQRNRNAGASVLAIRLVVIERRLDGRKIIVDPVQRRAAGKVRLACAAVRGEKFGCC